MYINEINKIPSYYYTRKEGGNYLKCRVHGKQYTVKIRQRNKKKSIYLPIKYNNNHLFKKSISD